AAAVGVALASLPPRTPPERVALARAMKPHGAAPDARMEVERAVRQGDSSAATLVLLGELLAGAGRSRDAERAYRAVAKDAALGPLAIYRRARILVRLGDPGAREALSGFAQSYPADTAAPTALYVLGDRLAAPPPPPPPPAVAAWLGRLDTLELAGLDSAAEAEVRMMLGRSPQQDVDALLAWSEGLAVRGFGPAAVRLGWQAALKAPADPR